jgi:hypothetical protein
MNARDDLHRLAQARPPILDHTHLALDVAAGERVLTQILDSPPPARRTPRGARLARRPSVIVGLATVTAAVAALAAVTDGRPGAPVVATGSPRTGTAVIGAQVLAHRTALALSAAGGDIEYDQITYAPGSAGKTASIRDSIYGLFDREYMTAEDGSPIYTLSGIVSGGNRYRRGLDYGSRTWSESSIPASQVGDISVKMITDSLRTFINGGLTKADGKPMSSGDVIKDGTLPDGTRVITVTSGPWTFHGPPAAGQGARVPMLAELETIPAATGAPRTVHTTVVIDASTYLPLQETVTTADGRSIISQKISWLPPTAANLAPLKAPLVSVPAGFTKTDDLDH